LLPGFFKIVFADRGPGSAKHRLSRLASRPGRLRRLRSPCRHSNRACPVWAFL